MVSDRPNRGNPIRPVSANAIAHRGFSSSFRGFDPVEVREFLGQVATEVDALQRRVAELETALAEQATMAAAAADQPVEQVRPQPLSAEELMAQVGEQTATVLRSAHAAAADITARAESEAAAALEQANSRAAHILDEAQARSAQVLAEAEPIAARIREEAETGAARLREGAEREVEGLLARAREQAESIRNQAEQERRLTVEGAQSVREKILSDLSRRRRVATVQIEQLRAGRERLLESYGVVRRTLEEVADELQRADAEARLAADEVGRRFEQADGDAAHPLDQVAQEQPADEHPEQEQPADEQPMAYEQPADEQPLAYEQPISGTAELGHPEGGDPHEATYAVDQGHGEALAGEPSPVGLSAVPEASVDADQAMGSARGAGGLGQSALSPGAVAQAVADAAVVEDPSTAGVSADQPSTTAEPGEVQAPGPRMRILQGGAGGEGNASASMAPSKVDSLFARLRSSRQQEVEQVKAPAPAAPGAGGAGVTEAGGAGVTEAGDADLGAGRDDDEERWLEQREKATSAAEATLVRRIKRVLQDDQNDLLDRLRSSKGKPSADQLLLELPEQLERFSAVAVAHLGEVVAAGAAFGAARGGDPGAGAGSEAAAKELAAQLAASLVEPLRERLEHTLSDWEGDDDSARVEALGAVYREWKTHRVDKAVGDQVAGAYAAGTRAAFADGASFRWVVDDLDGPCPDCDDNALAGYLPGTEPFPTGVARPPAHAGCRCLLVPET
ncbi:MAG: DivIVA domain-containing protein [Acidimicrobiales bacterium]